jgi:hypothetical protein
MSARWLKLLGDDPPDQFAPSVQSPLTGAAHVKCCPGAARGHPRAITTNKTAAASLLPVAYRDIDPPR